MRTLLVSLSILAFTSCFSQAEPAGYGKVRNLTQIYLDSITSIDNMSKQAIARKDYETFQRLTFKKSMLFSNISNKERSLATLFDGLKLTQKHKRRIPEMQLLRGIGNIYNINQDFEKAKTYYWLCKKLARQYHQDSIVESLYQPLFKIHYDTRSDSIGYYLEKAMSAHRKRNIASGLAKGYNNYAVYFYNRKEYNLAEKYADSMLHFARLSGSRSLIGTNLTNRAALYFDRHDFKAAKSLYDELFAMNPGDTVTRQAAANYYTYAEILRQLGYADAAFAANDRAYVILDDSYDQKAVNAASEVEISYRMDKLEEDYRRRQTEARQRESRNRRVLFILIGVLSMSLILFYFFFQNTRLKQKNKLKDIESQQKQILLTATIDAQENERKKIASALHDNISALLSSAGLQLTAFSAAHRDTANSEEITKARDILRSAHDHVRSLSHDLVPTLLAKFGLSYAVLDLCEKISNPNLRFDCNTESIGDKRFDPDFEMRVYFITAELMNNVLKHSGGSLATLDMREVDGQLQITVEDNGVGFDTETPKADGFGLTQIKARVSSLSGSIILNSKPGQGTYIMVKAPVPVKS